MKSSRLHQAAGKFFNKPDLGEGFGYMGPKKARIQLEKYGVDHGMNFSIYVFLKNRSF